MTRVENLIVEGKCFIPMDDQKQYVRLKETIAELMNIKGFKTTDTNLYIDHNKFLSMSFATTMLNLENSFSLKIKRLLGLVNENRILFEKHQNGLKNTRNDIPFMITFNIIPDILKNQNGFYVQIRSEPAILFQMRQLNWRPTIDEFMYSNIVETNRQFINEIMFSMSGTIIEKPKALAEIFQTPFIDVLRNLGFKKISTLLKQGSLKLERGDIEDGLTDLRSALEQFFKEMVERINEKPTSNIPNNLDILKKNGYIDEHLHSIIKNTLYEWIYRHISNKSVHKREKINIYEAKLIFSISELIMNYLIEKVVYRR